MNMNHRMNTSGRLASVAVAAIMMGTHVLSDTVTWQGPVDGIGEWSVTNNWPGGTLPLPTDYVFIPTGRTAVVGEATTATVTTRARPRPPRKP